MESVLYVIFFLLIFVCISFLIMIMITYDKKQYINLDIEDKNKNKSKCIKTDPVIKNKDLVIPDNIQITFRSREEDLKRLNSIPEFTNNYTKNTIISPNMNLRYNPYVITKYKPCNKTKTKNTKNMKNTKNRKNKLYDSMYYDKTNKIVKKKNIKWLPVKESECLI